MPGSPEVKRRYVQSKESEAKDNVSEASSDGVNLKRTVGLTGGISFIVGIVIGSGIFISPKGVSRGSGSVGLALINWTICGIISLAGALCYAELGTVVPESGGEHIYLLESFGSVFAFLFDWSVIVLIRPAAISAVSLTCAEYVMVPLFDDGCGQPPVWHVRMFAILIILFLLAINTYSAKLASGIQVIFTVAKVVALAIIIIGGIVYMANGNTQNLTNAFRGTESDVGKVALGLYQGMWAYEGWNNLNYVTEELENPSRNLPLSICIGVPLVIVVYLLTNISYFSVMSIQEMLDSPAVGVTWAEAIIPRVTWIIPVSVALSTFGGANGSLFTSSRISFAAGRTGFMPECLTYVNVNRHTPFPSLLVIALISIIYTLVGDIASLIDYLNFTRWIFYGIVMGSLFYFRWKRKDADRPLKVPLIIPIFVLIAAVFLVVVPIAMEPQMEFLYAFLVIIGGLIFYIPFVWLKWVIPGMDHFNTFVQLSTVTSPPESMRKEYEEKEVMELKE